VTRRRLEAHRRGALGEHLASQVGDGPFHDAQADVDPELPLQLLPHDVAVAPVLPESISEPLGVLRQSAGARWRPVRLPPPLAHVPAHRVAAATQLRGNALGSPTQRCKLEHRLHVFRRLHRLAPLQFLELGSLPNNFFHSDLLPRRGSFLRVARGSVCRVA
jgi:hypothetical protein